MKCILGTAQFGSAYGINNKAGKLTPETCSAVLNFAWQEGVRFLDTAFLYGDALERIAQYHATSTTRFEVINKISRNRQNWRQELLDSFGKLRLEHYHSLLFHSFEEYLGADEECIDLLLSLKEIGKIKNVGVSVYTNEQLSLAIDDALIDVIQVPYNLLDNDNIRNQRFRKAKEFKKEIHVRSVFLQGLFFMDRALIPGKLGPLLPFLDNLQEIAQAHHLSMEALALSYVIQNKYIDGVVLGVESVSNLEENLKVLRMPLNPLIIEDVNVIKVKDQSLLLPGNWS
jgi:aryl-alcohol dehydrogenase-like predicted oxidoreductase